jgi:hypothetical protein
MRRIVRVVAVLVVVLLVAAMWTAIARPALWRTIWSFVRDYRWALAGVVAVAVLLLSLRTILRHPPGAPWKVHILATADDIQHQLDALPVGEVVPVPVEVEVAVPAR